MSTKPRIEPLTPPYTPDVEASLRKWMPKEAAVEPLALFRTIARHPALSDRLRHLGAFFLGHGSLPLRIRELVILRTTARCGAEYEWGVHVSAFGAAAGLDASIVDATVRAAPLGGDLDALTLRAVDELHDEGTLSDATYHALAAHFDEQVILELLALTGFYHLVSFLAGAVRVEHEPWARFPAVHASMGTLVLRSRSMSQVDAHYEELLADVYSWMLGDFDARVEAQVAWLREAVGAPEASAEASAIDLGAGSGADAIALARLGYRVTAVDTSDKLVREARERVAEATLSHPVDVVKADVISFLEEKGASSSPAHLVTCLGDTLTHLDSIPAIQRMFRAARGRLGAGGKLALTFRDLSTELRGLDRFFLVRSDDARIFTCFVEYMEGRVIVHDILHERTERGWSMRTSCYPKLRLPMDDVCAWLADAGFGIVERVEAGRGLVGVVAR